MKSTPLCALDDIDDGESAGFVAEVCGVTTRIMVVRKGLNVYLYENSCPHILSPLDFTPGRFLTPEKDMILCSTHGALFRIEDGHCVHGPCLGKHLAPIAGSVRDGAVWLD